MDLVILFPDQSQLSLPFQSLELMLYQLQHPKYGDFLCLYHQQQWYELQSCVLRKYNTYFLDQRVSNSPYLYLATPFDLKYLLLPHLCKAKAQYSPLDQIIPSSSNLLPFLRDPLQYQTLQLDRICDVNTSFGEDCPMFRYNADKTLQWLKGKVSRLSQILQKQRLEKEHSQNPSFVASFQLHPAPSQTQERTEKALGAASKEDEQMAVEIICDLLSEDLTQTLLAAYQMTASDFTARTSLVGKRKADWEVALEVRNTLFDSFDESQCF